MGMDFRRLHCIWCDMSLKGAKVIVGNSISDIVMKFRRHSPSDICSVEQSQQMDYPFRHGNACYRYCYVIQRRPPAKSKYLFKCPFCKEVHSSGRRNANNGKIKCPYCKVVADADIWEEVCE